MERAGTKGPRQKETETGSAYDNRIIAGDQEDLGKQPDSDGDEPRESTSTSTSRHSKNTHKKRAVRGGPHQELVGYRCREKGRHPRLTPRRGRERGTYAKRVRDINLRGTKHLSSISHPSGRGLSRCLKGEKQSRLVGGFSPRRPLSQGGSTRNKRRVGEVKPGLTLRSTGRNLLQSPLKTSALGIV